MAGAGPAGLYAALLLKKADPGRSIRVLERNPPNSTYGWGVVFSQQTLESLREADRDSYEMIAGSFARWDAIDIHLDRARVMRAHGHRFAGLSRHGLLSILQGRCLELGVELRFDQALEGPPAPAEYDLVIAADGLRSELRTAYADRFGPSFDERTARFVWYGTTLRPDAFTYVVRSTPHGLVQATFYPYLDDRSTFIVECSAATWQGLGFDRMTEAGSLRSCERLFADVLAGHRLMSNRSRWSRFVTVRNRRWHHGNLVLLGDAAHTVHFSIGSGTKVAMEDAIALSRALDERPDLESALTWYEQARLPVVDVFQEAAYESLRWFEHLDRYVSKEPHQFVFNFLIRSGRITYDEVRARDPRFADSVDRWFSGAARGLPAETSPVVAPPPLFNPLTVRGLTIPNRAVALDVGDAPAADGAPGAGHASALTGLARSGAGLVMTGIVAVCPEGRITPLDAGLYSRAQRDAWQEVVRVVRASAPARLGIRLGHAGARGSTVPRRRGLDRPLREGGWELVAASPLPYAASGQRPREMTRRDMDAVLDAFARSAEAAAEAGFDLLELHLGHGFLLAGFVSPLTNQREDEYGGAIDGRLRFPLEVVTAVRRSWPPDRPLAVAYSASDWAAGGLTEEEAIQVAIALREAGADLVDVLAGQTVRRSRPRSFRGHFLARLSEVVRSAGRVPTIARGGLAGSDDMNTVLAAGQADLCVMEPWALADSGRWRG